MSRRDAPLRPRAPRPLRLPRRARGGGDAPHRGDGRPRRRLYLHRPDLRRGHRRRRGLGGVPRAPPRPGAGDLRHRAMTPPVPRKEKRSLKGAPRALAKQLPGTFRLVWDADRKGTVAIAFLTLLSGLFPAAIAWVGKLIIDAVVVASSTGTPEAREQVFVYVAIEAGLVLAMTVAGRLSRLVQELLRASLGRLIN